MLSPRVYEALTCSGQALTGVGIVDRLETEIRRRAKEEFHATRNPNKLENWLNAERQMVRPKASALLQHSSLASQLVVEDLRNLLAESTACVQKLEAENQGLLTKLSLQDAELKRMRQELDDKAPKCCHAQDMNRSGEGKGSMRFVWLQQELASTDRLLHKRTQLLTQTEDALKQAREELIKKTAELKGLENEVVTLRRVCAEQKEELNAFHDNQSFSLGMGSDSWQISGSGRQDLSEKVEYLQQELTLTEELLAERNTRIHELEIAKATQNTKMAKMMNELVTKFAETTDRQHAKEGMEVSNCRQATS